MEDIKTEIIAQADEINTLFDGFKSAPAGFSSRAAEDLIMAMENLIDYLNHVLWSDMKYVPALTPGHDARINGLIREIQGLGSAPGDQPPA
jgi:hypothetical protein